MPPKRVRASPVSAISSGTVHPAGRSGSKKGDKKIGRSDLPVRRTKHCLGRIPVLRSLLLVIGLFGITAAASANQSTGSIYFSIVPPNWRLLPADEQTHERRFVS